MKIELLLFARLKEAAGRDRWWLEIAEGTKVRELAQKIIHEPDLADCRELPLLYALNESFVTGDETLNEGDTLALMTPVAGGAA